MGVSRQRIEDESHQVNDVDRTDLLARALAGEHFSLDSRYVDIELVAALVAAATNDTEFMPLPKDRPTFAHGSSFNGCRFEPNASFHSLRLSAFGFSGADLPDADFYKSFLSKADFTSATLDNSIFISATLREVNLITSDLTNTKFYRAQLSHSRFDHAALTRCSFREATLSHCNFRESKLNRTSFREATVSDCLFSHVALTNTNFRDANIINTVFENVYWDPAHPPVWPQNFAAPSNSFQDKGTAE